MVRGTFWSTGQVIMSAVAGIDIALWDLKGKRLGVPVYELLGGPTREQVRVYRHLAGDRRRSSSRTRSAGTSGVHGAPLRPARRLDEQSLTEWDPQRSIVADDRGARRRCAHALGDDVDLLLDAHTMFSPAEAAYLGHALEPYRLFFYEDPIRPLNPQSLRARARQGQPPDRDRRAARAQVGVPAADRERARRLPPHRHGPRGWDHRGEEDPRRGRGARAAIGAPPRELAGQRRGLPARRHGGARTSASRNGWSSSRCTSSSRTRLAPRPATSCHPKARASGSSSTRRRHASAPRAMRDSPPLLAGRRRRRLLTGRVPHAPGGAPTSWAERTSPSAAAAASIDCSRQPGAYGDCCSW